ncbi:hypothetical protein DXG01_001560 [Tephrocybe rancida]|nr:hypothetical protein DXG01_001560 [Tephrocybe rancida]
MPTTPFIFERYGPALEQQEFVCIPSITVNLYLSGKRGTKSSKTGDTCEVSVVIPKVEATFQLAYVYSLLLAVQCIKNLLPRTPPNHAVKTKAPSELKVKIKIVIPTVQVMFVLRTHWLALRIDDINSEGLPGRSPTLQLGKLTVWACLSRIHNWEDERGDKWEDARLRIAYCYIFADFVTDASVTAKAIHHLTRIMAHRMYTPMPIPEAEGPKHVLGIIVRLGCLYIEAADDPRERNDRESAFKAKVAAMYQAESQVPSGSAAEKDSQFGGEHSVSIDQARRRLDEVHELDWALRLREIRQKHSKSEAINQLLRRKYAKKGPGAKPSSAYRAPEAPKPSRKTIAKVRSGVRFGVGSASERAYGDECHTCAGTAFQGSADILRSVHIIKGNRKKRHQFLGPR